MRVAAGKEDLVSQEAHPTPHYNNALLGERLSYAHYKLMHSVLMKMPLAVKRGVTL